MYPDHVFVEISSLRFIFIDFGAAANLDEKFAVFDFDIGKGVFVLREIVCDVTLIDEIIEMIHQCAHPLLTADRLIKSVRRVVKVDGFPFGNGGDVEGHGVPLCVK